MALFADISELQLYLETDLPEEVIETYMRDAEDAIVARWGPNFEDLDLPLTRYLRGGYYALFSVPGNIVEIREGDTVLGPTDYRLLAVGVLERLPVGRKWASRVEVDYSPPDTTEARRRALVQLVNLAIEYSPWGQQRIGDVAEGNPVVYADERKRIIESIATARIVVA